MGEREAVMFTGASSPLLKIKMPHKRRVYEKVLTEVALGN